MKCVHYSMVTVQGRNVVDECFNVPDFTAPNGFLCAYHQRIIRSVKKRHPITEGLSLIEKEKLALHDAPREVVRLVTRTGAKIQYLR